MKADPARAAAQGEFTRSGWGYLAMVCVYLYGMVQSFDLVTLVLNYSIVLTCVCGLIDLLHDLARNNLGM